MFEGFADRLKKELNSLADDSSSVRVIAPKYRKTSAFIGGCVLASLNSFQDCWITREEYDEIGPDMIH